LHYTALFFDMINISDKNNIIGLDFRVAKRSEKDSSIDVLSKEKKYFKSSLIISILLVTLIFLLFPKFPHPEKKTESPMIVLDIEDIPVTKHTGKTTSKPPSRPFIPIPSETSIIEEIDVEDWEISNTFELPGLPPGPGGFGGTKGEGANVKTNPRIMLEVIPEYNESEIEKGKTGIVKLFIVINKKGEVESVEVLENTTESKIIEKAVIDAVYKTKYTPAMLNGRAVKDEIVRVWKFELSNEK